MSFLCTPRIALSFYLMLNLLYVCERNANTVEAEGLYFMLKQLCVCERNANTVEGLYHMLKQLCVCEHNAKTVKGLYLTFKLLCVCERPSHCGRPLGIRIPCFESLRILATSRRLLSN